VVNTLRISLKRLRLNGDMSGRTLVTKHPESANYIGELRHERSILEVIELLPLAYLQCRTIPLRSLR